MLLVFHQSEALGQRHHFEYEDSHAVIFRDNISPADSVRFRAQSRMFLVPQVLLTFSKAHKGMFD